MTTGLELIVIVTWLLLLIGVSALAGALWSRVRAYPVARAARLAEELAERLAALEAANREGTAKGAGRAEPAGSVGPIRRVDRGEARTASGPTLITVPDLSAAVVASEAADELTRRFGAIWDLAEAGTPTEAIARAVGQPIGQVELILGLRRKMMTAARGGRT